MDIEVIEERDNDVLVLLPVDRIDSTNARAFESIIMDRINNDERRLIIDFSHLNFISSSGLRVLLIAVKKLNANQGKLVLCDMQEHIHEVFQISGFDQLIPIRAAGGGLSEGRRRTAWTQPNNDEYEEGTTHDHPFPSVGPVPMRPWGVPGADVGCGSCRTG